MNTDTSFQSNAMTDDLVLLDFSAGFHCTAVMIFLGFLSKSGLTEMFILRIPKPGEQLGQKAVQRCRRKIC